MSFIYFTPQVNQKLPQTLVYDYHELQTYNRNIGLIDGLVVGDQTIQSDNMSLSTIPNKVYIFIKESERTHSATSSDCFARLKKIQINFNGVSGVMASASEWELWRMSVNNGLKISYPQWTDYTGSVLCIDFGKDIGLSPNQCVGLLGQYDFNFTLTYTALNTQ